MVLDGALVDYSVQKNLGVINYADGQVTFTGAEWKSKRAPVKRMRVRAEIVDGRIVSVMPVDEAQQHQQTVRRYVPPADANTNRAEAITTQRDSNKVFGQVLFDIFITGLVFVVVGLALAGILATE